MQFFKQYPNEWMKPKLIAELSGLNYNTTRRLVRELWRRNYILWRKRTSEYMYFYEEPVVIEYLHFWNDDYNVTFDFSDLVQAEEFLKKHPILEKLFSLLK